MGSWKMGVAATGRDQRGRACDRAFDCIHASATHPDGVVWGPVNAHRIGTNRTRGVRQPGSDTAVSMFRTRTYWSAPSYGLPGCGTSRASHRPEHSAG